MRISPVREAAFQCWGSAEGLNNKVEEATALIWCANICVMPPAMSCNTHCNKHQISLCVWTDELESVLNAVSYCWQPRWLYTEREAIKVNRNINREAAGVRIERSQPSIQEHTSRGHFRMVMIFTFWFSTFGFFFFYPSLFHSLAVLCPLSLLYWNSGVIFIYTCKHWQNRELEWYVCCRWYICIIGVRKHSMPCSDSISMLNQVGLNLRFGVYESPAGLGDFAHVGWQGGQEAVVQRMTYSTPHCDTEAQQQVLDAGPRLPPSCSPQPGSCKDRPPLIRKGRKHRWWHHGKGDVGTEVIQGPGGQRAKESRGICCSYQ